MGIDFTQTENETQVVAYVSPGKARYFSLPADLFFGAKDIYIEVKEMNQCIQFPFLFFSFSFSFSFSFFFALLCFA